MAACVVMLHFAIVSYLIPAPPKTAGALSREAASEQRRAAQLSWLVAARAAATKKLCVLQSL
jgi:hypothetical protein